jgi:DNA topoisomerase IB
VARIGGLNNEKDGKPTYGLSTLQVRHANVNKGTLILSYDGKDGIHQRHVIKPDTDEKKRIIAIVERLMRGKGRSDPLWTDPNGKRIDAGRFNAYLKSLKIPITAHKFRHIRGTLLMSDLIAKARIAKDAPQNEVEAGVKKLATRVGELLGHKSGDKVTPATAIKAYIVPSVIAAFFKSRGLRVPHWLPQGGQDND